MERLLATPKTIPVLPSSGPIRATSGTHDTASRGASESPRFERGPFRAPAPPAQRPWERSPRVTGGGGRGERRRSPRRLTNRRPHASQTRERSEDLGRLVGEMADDDVGVAHRPERPETLDDLVHRARNERLPIEPAVSAGDRGFEDRLGLARRLADVDVATDRGRRRRAAIDGAALAVVRGLAARLVEREPGRGEPAIAESRGAIDGDLRAGADPDLDRLRRRRQIGRAHV